MLLRLFFILCTLSWPLCAMHNVGQKKPSYTEQKNRLIQEFLQYKGRKDGSSQSREMLWPLCQPLLLKGSADSLVYALASQIAPNDQCTGLRDIAAQYVIDREIVGNIIKQIELVGTASCTDRAQACVDMLNALYKIKRDVTDSAQLKIIAEAVSAIDAVKNARDALAQKNALDQAVTSVMHAQSFNYARQASEFGQIMRSLFSIALVEEPSHWIILSAWRKKAQDLISSTHVAALLVRYEAESREFQKMLDALNKDIAKEATTKKGVKTLLTSFGTINKSIMALEGKKFMYQYGQLEADLYRFVLSSYALDKYQLATPTSSPRIHRSNIL